MESPPRLSSSIPRDASGRHAPVGAVLDRRPQACRRTAHAVRNMACSQLGSC